MVQNVFFSAQIRVMIVIFKVAANLGDFLAQFAYLLTVALCLYLLDFQNLEQFSFLLLSGLLFFLDSRQVSLQSVTDHLELVLQNIVTFHGPLKLQLFDRRPHGQVILRLVALRLQVWVLIRACYFGQLF